MVESQSRYSIVERLTMKKIEIMSSKSKLQKDLKHKEQKIEELKKDLENWEKDIEEDMKREKRKKQRQIENADQDYENIKARLTDKEKSHDNQIKAIEEALQSIEEISKTSPTLQKS